MLYIYPYKAGSRSVMAFRKSLSSEGFKTLEIKLEQSKFAGKSSKTVINWGNSHQHPEVSKSRVINKPQQIAVASNKLLTFNCLRDAGVPVPEFSEEEDDAMSWLLEDSTVFARTTLNGHSGAGIVEINKGDEIVDAPLYVRYVKKKDEYRIHVFKNRETGGYEALHIQRKARRTDVPDNEVNWKIRNHSNGFIFASGDGVADNTPTCVLDSAIHAVASLHLDFGAVDVIYNDKQKQAYVLEVNTAPGLEGRTLGVYCDYFKTLI